MILIIIIFIIKMKTEIIINKFINLLDINKIYNLSEILNILDNVYLEEKKQKKEILHYIIYLLKNIILYFIINIHF